MALEVWPAAQGQCPAVLLHSRENDALIGEEFQFPKRGHAEWRGMDGSGDSPRLCFCGRPGPCRERQGAGFAGLPRTWNTRHSGRLSASRTRQGAFLEVLFLHLLSICLSVLRHQGRAGLHSSLGTSPALTCPEIRGQVPGSLLRSHLQTLLFKTLS